MISAVEFKRHIAGASILGIIIGKFCYKKKPCLIILLKVDKNSEVGFHYAILPFGLIVYLWIEGDREPLLDAKEIA